MSKKTIKTYITATLIMQLLMGLHAAIYVTYLTSNNLSLLQVNLVNFFFMISVFLLEIPTGAVADIFGRKFSFVLSNIITGIGFLVYSVADNFFGFVVAEVVIALGLTLTSGAFKAWLVDSLKYYKWNGSLLNVFRTEGRVTNVAKLAGGVIGAYIGINNMTIPFAVAGFGFLILSIFSCIIMKEHYFQKRNGEKIMFWMNMRQIIGDSVKYGIKHRVVFLIVTIMVVFLLGFQAINMYWQPWFRPHVPGNEYLGYIWAGIVIFTLIGNELVSWFAKKFKNIKIGYFIIGMCLGLTILLSAMPVVGISFIGFYIHEIFRGMFGPYTNAILQKNIPSKTRATIDSFVSMAKTGAAALGLVLSGIVANTYGIGMSWIFSGLIIICLLPIAMLINGRKNRVRV